MMTFLLERDMPELVHIDITISEDSSLEEVVGAFKGFLKACGYHSESVDSLFVE